MDSIYRGYPAMIVPLARFFATDAVSGFHPSAKQRRALIRWFWRSCFSLRYSSGVGKAHAQDIEWMDRLKNDEDTDIKINTQIMPHAFFWNNFNIGTVFTKIFVLTRSMSPRIVSRSLIDNLYRSDSSLVLRRARGQVQVWVVFLNWSNKKGGFSAAL